MYKNVVDDDGGLESMNDKCTSCILLLSGLLTLTDNLRSKVLSLNNLDLLEEMVTFLRRIYCLVVRVVVNYCKEPLSELHKSPGSFYPLIRQARQMEIFSLLSDIEYMLHGLKKKNYFWTCNKVYVLNEFVKTLRPSSFFLQKFLLKHKHFHIVLLPPEKKQPRYYKRY